jgi:hypothetical protein
LITAAKDASTTTYHKHPQTEKAMTTSLIQVCLLATFLLIGFWATIGVAWSFARNEADRGAMVDHCASRRLIFAQIPSAAMATFVGIQNNQPSFADQLVVEPPLPLASISGDAKKVCCADRCRLAENWMPNSFAITRISHLTLMCSSSYSMMVAC